MRIRLSAVRALIGISLLSGLSGCIFTSPDVASSLLPVSGGSQTVAVNAAAPKPLTVVVQDQDQNPMENVTVEWRIRSGSGTLSSTETNTNGDGIASVTYTAGASAGKTVIFAVVPQLGAGVTFTMTVQ